MKFEPYNQNPWQEATDPESAQATRVAYLESLQQAESTSPVPDNTREGQAVERRRDTRFKCEGNMEICTDGSTIRTWATFRDLGLSGCYVEMMTTYPVGTKLELALEMKGFSFRTEGVVRVAYPFLGMGIEFGLMSAKDRQALEQMMAGLAAGAGSETAHAKPTDAKELAMPEIVWPEAILGAMVEFFAGHNMLTREEFIELAKQSQCL